MTNITGFICCFCNKEIIEDNVDPIDLNIHLTSDRKQERRGQYFYAHFECMKQKLHPSVQGYFVKEDDDC